MQLVTLIMEESVGKCNYAADSFVHPRFFVFRSGQAVNCTIFEVDQDSSPTCYILGFYLLKAFSTSAGLLYIEASLLRIVFPFAKLFIHTKDNKRGKHCHHILTMTFFMLCILWLVIYIILVFALPSSSLGYVLGIDNTLTMIMLAAVQFFMAMAVFMYPEQSY